MNGENSFLLLAGSELLETVLQHLTDQTAQSSCTDYQDPHSSNI